MKKYKISKRKTRSSPRAVLVFRLLAITIAALLFWLIALSLTDQLLGPQMSLAKHIVNAIVIFSVTVPAVLALNRIFDQLPLVDFGLAKGRSLWRDLTLGFITWLLPAGIGIGAAIAFGWLDIGVHSSGLELIAAATLLVVLVFVFEAFPEELLFRGYIQRNLMSKLPVWVAITLQAGLFTFWGTGLWVISDGWGVLIERALLFFSMGIVLGALRHIAGSLWAPIGFHLGFQVTMQLALGTRYADIHINSEWLFTLVTTVFAFCTATAIASVFWRRYRNHEKPKLEQ